MFRKIADKEAEMVVAVHVDDILARAKDQATMERFAAELGRKFNLKDPGREERDVKVLIPIGSGGAHVGGTRDTVGHCVRGTCCDQVL